MKIKNIESEYNKPLLNYGKKRIKIGLLISKIKNILFCKVDMRNNGSYTKGNET